MKEANTLSVRLKQVIYILLAAVCFLPSISPAIALFAGLVFALLLGNVFPKFNKNASKYLLQFSVVGLGFGMNLHESIKAGADGILFTIASVVFVLFIGIILGKWLKINKTTSYLIAGGTAICGGSAIAAISPVAKADSDQTSISLAIVFILNAVALFIFPSFGRAMELSQEQFGVWSAIAIHDTSSVVGAAASYGNEALQIATTVKLTRALWIIPLSLYTAFYFKAEGKKLYIPWFILFFILAMLINTFFNMPENTALIISTISRKGLTLTLFFIGAALSAGSIKKVGFRAFVLGILLWIVIGVSSLAFVFLHY